MDVSLSRGEFQKYRISLTLVLFLGFFGAGTPLFVGASEWSFGENVLEFQEDGATSETAEAEPLRICEGEFEPRPDESEEEFQFRMTLERLLRNEPMAPMASLIAKRDRETAAFLVSIARKESSWGRHAPSKDGIDCFNYWGFKGEGSRGVGMGHACFGSREEAVETVGNRLAVLIHEKKLNSPERLIVWKCGSSCAGHSPESVAKWIADVRFIYARILPNG